MSSKNIVLLGFMGAGKTTVAKLLGQMLARKVVSTDELIVEKEGRSITDIFRDSGEPYFRTVEKEVIEEISSENNLIIDCGGGVILNLSNIDALKKNGLTVYLEASPETVYERVCKETHRPLLAVDDPMSKIKELLAHRSPLYEQAALKVKTDAFDIQNICDIIISHLNKD